MKINEISSIIEKAINEITERDHRDVCSDCWIVSRNLREDTIEGLGFLLDIELFKLEELMDGIIKDACNSKEVDPEIYKRLDGAEEHLNAIRIIAEIKRYLEAKNNGIIKVRFYGCD
jgi:hypothetical protein